MKYKDAYNNRGEDEDEEKNKLLYLHNCNEAFEKFIDKYSKDFNNENLLEKHHLYVKELFLSYI